jgi:putative transposase
MSSTTLRTYVLPRRALLPCAQALYALTRHAKDLRNSTVFVVRQVLSAYAGGQLKEDLAPAQAAMLMHVERCVAQVNAARAAKAKSKADAKADVESAKPPKLLARFEQVAKPFAILNATLLDNVVRALPAQDPQGPQSPGAAAANAYRSLPASAAQQVLRDVAESFTSWRKALVAYARNPEAFTGRPAMPGYLPRHARTVLALPWVALCSGRLPGLQERALYLDYARTQLLPDAARQALRDLDWAGAAEELRGRHGLGEAARPVELRLVPRAGRKTRVEVVFELVQPELLPVAALLEQALPTQLKGEEREEALRAQLAALPARHFAQVAGCDFGLNNLATVAYCSGARGFAVSGARIERWLAALDARLDAAISAATGPELRVLQARKDQDEHLSPAEWARLRSLRTEVHAQPQVRALRERRAGFVQDSAHRLTQGIVARLVAAGVQVLVVGQNKGWKNGAQQARNQARKGRAFNRRNHRIPHALLLAQLRYKARAAGVLVIATEESYTSKTSFALNEPLQSIARTKAQAPRPACASEIREPRTDEHSTADAVAPETAAAAKSTLAGRRVRHVFTVASAPVGWRRMHADLNAAFNVVRKAVLKFRWHAALSPLYELLWLSPKRGLQPMKLRPA